MALWAFIPDKEIVSVGALPSAARRLDTGQWVTDVVKWAQACGYWDLDSPTVADDFRAARPDITDEEFDALKAEVLEKRGRRDDLDEWSDIFGSYLSTMQTRAGENLQDYGRGDLGIPGFPDIGDQWPVSNQSQQINILRTGMTYALHDVFVLAHMLRVLGLVVRDVVRDSDIDLPAPPQLG